MARIRRPDGPALPPRAGGPRRVLLAAALALGWAGPVAADGLTIFPVGLNIAAPATSGTITVRADGIDRVPLQIRVVRWTRSGNEDRYAATRDVVVSPPAAQLRRGEEMTLRIVRTATAPVVGRECYRVVIDQLPDLGGGSGGRVALTLRHSLPLCFVAAG